jgi:hypothetical protein
MQKGKKKTSWASKHMTLRDHKIDFDIENVRVRFVDYMMVVYSE